MNTTLLELNKTFCDFCKSHHSQLHADFEYLLCDGVICIVDLDQGHRSVTNDIEYVLWCISKNDNKLPHAVDKNGAINLSDFKIIYSNSKGIFDGVKTKNNQFDSFYPIRTSNKVEALKTASGVL